MPRSAQTRLSEEKSPRKGDARARAAGARPRGADRKRQIANETLRLVAKHGLQGTSMSRIAGAVGVSTAALYRHFGSRDDILIAAFEVLMDRFTLWLQISDNPCALERLREMCAYHASLFSEDVEGWNAPMFQFTVYIPQDRVREHVRARRAQMFDAVEEIIEEGKAQGSISPAVDVHQAVADLYAWIYWEDLSYLEGLNHAFTRKNSEEMYERILERIAASPPGEAAMPDH